MTTDPLPLAEFWDASHLRCTVATDRHTMMGLALWPVISRIHSPGTSLIVDRRDVLFRDTLDEAGRVLDSFPGVSFDSAHLRFRLPGGGTVILTNLPGLLGETRFKSLQLQYLAVLGEIDENVYGYLCTKLRATPKASVMGARQILERS